MTELTIMGRVHIKKIIEFSIKDLTQKKIIKRHVVFLGLFSSFGSKQIFENFSPAPPTTATHWSNKLLSPHHHHHQPLTLPIATSHHFRWWQWWMVAEVGWLMVMGVSDSRWWVVVVPGVTTTASHWSRKLTTTIDTHHRCHPS